MLDSKLRSLIREMVEEALQSMYLSEGSKIGGYDVDNLTYAEKEELEAFVSGYIDASQIENPVVRNLVAAGPKTRTRRDPDDISSITRKPSGPPTTPAAPMPAWSGRSVGEVAGWHESLRPTGKFGGSQNKETGEWTRFRIKTKQADPHWVWTGKRWVSDTEFDRLNRMEQLPER